MNGGDLAGFVSEGWTDHRISVSGEGWVEPVQRVITHGSVADPAVEGIRDWVRQVGVQHAEPVLA